MDRRLHTDTKPVSLKQPTICQILGTGYSGSSILNLMLDSIENVRGLGEVRYIYGLNEEIRPCSICQSSLDNILKECGFYDDINRDEFYSGCFSKYPDAHVLVDSSKIGIYYPRAEQQFDYKSLYLLKWPHEYVAGEVFRGTELSIQDRFEGWLTMNENELRTANGSLVIPYRSLALQPDDVLRSICNFLQIAFLKREDWWNTTTHIIGGNWSVRAQTNQRLKVYLEENEKYKDHFHEIFLDESWREMSELCQACIGLYKQHHKRCDTIFKVLGIPSTEVMIADIEGRKIGYIPPHRLNQSEAEALKWWRKSGDNGDAITQYDIGLAFHIGNNIAKNDVEAVQWWQKAAEQGHADAQDHLGHAYHLGQGVTTDVTEAVKWWQKAAEQGHADAQNQLAHAYHLGQGVTKDDTEAAKWWQKAAEQGHVDAQNYLAHAYHLGRGVTKDDTQAVRWLQKAAEQGHADAQSNLGTAYYGGYGNLPKNDVEAVKWWLRAAEQGEKLAQGNIGSAYHLGIGNVRKDDTEAMKWWQKAAEQSNPSAQFLLTWHCLP